MRHKRGASTRDASLQQLQQLRVRLAAWQLQSVLPMALTMSLLVLLLLTALQPAAAAATCAHDLTPCSLTFAAFDAACTGDAMVSNVPKQVEMLPYLSVAALCPMFCQYRAEAIPVFGSFPYHSSSSVCMSAIHAGVINGSAGGGVFVSRFNRQDWSNGSTQTIFPFGSWRGSLSNSVQSLNVSSDWYSVPSSDSEWSYTVRGRGDFLSQRRHAPFPPRAGHVHVATNYADVNNSDAYRSYSVHVIVGGHNSTHYLNSVWLGTQQRPAGGGQYRDINWQQMPDAPFSPRSDMLVRPTLMLPSPQRGDRQPFILIMGGQTGHHCGLRELGECSNEVWRLDVVMANDSSGLRTSWSDGPLWTLPFSPRCDAGLTLHSDRIGGYVPVLGRIVYTEYDYLRFYGGQLSYNDSSCVAAPVTVNDVWGLNISLSGALLPQHLFQVGPFSPRRLGQPATWSFESTAIDRSDRIFGGLRHVNFSRSIDGSGLRLTGSELYADVWWCDLYSTKSLQGCLWNPDGAGSIVASASLPVPTANGLFAQSTRFTSFLDFGGILAKDAIEQWTQTLPWVPPGIEPNWSEAVSNMSTVTAPVVTQQRSMQDILDQRQGLPLVAVMGEQELNDPEGSYALGSEWVQGWAGGSSEAPPLSAMASLHRQPLAFAVDPEQSSWWVPQPASSRNTTRPLFNFPLRRLHHRSFSFEVLTVYEPLFRVAGETVISGGMVGGLASSDWIVATAVRCLPPNDPSFATVLGPVQVMSHFPEWASVYTFRNKAAGSYPVLTQLPVNCPAGYHLQPPTLWAEAVITCAPSGMWLDSSAFAITQLREGIGSTALGCWQTSAGWTATRCCRCCRACRPPTTSATAGACCAGRTQ